MAGSLPLAVLRRLNASALARGRRRRFDHRALIFKIAKRDRLAVDRHGNRRRQVPSGRSRRGRMHGAERAAAALQANRRHGHPVDGEDHASCIGRGVKAASRDGNRGGGCPF